MRCAVALAQQRMNDTAATRIDFKLALSATEPKALRSSFLYPDRR
jgi:hypothetical protein